MEVKIGKNKIGVYHIFYSYPSLIQNDVINLIAD